ncbi:hypothetical protein MMC21_004162 [Puttea exsequens]|nr:hypothetical protein [Puttea exsequens]
MEYYVYEDAIDVDHIRVMTLQPAGAGEPLQCTLDKVALDAETLAAMAYEALSYVWGSKNKTQHIHCKGKPLSITQDLESCLLYLRNETSPTRLWIDQICINQNNIDERSAQVKIMGTIYRSAKRVVAWLGEASALSDLGIQFANELFLALFSYIYLYPGIMIVNSDLGKPLPPTRFHLPQEDAVEWLALCDLYSRNYFRRLWIVQEALLNDETIAKCGESEFPLSMLIQLSDQFRRHQALAALLHKKSGASDGSVLATKLAIVAKPDFERNFDHLVSLFAAQQVCDPRDYIYGLASLANESHSSHISPNYNKSVAEVFTEFARVMIKDCGCKSVLNMVELNLNDTIGTPSWVPDWTTHPLVGLTQPCRMLSDHFSTSTSSAESWEFVNDGNVLRIKGRRVDELVVEGLSHPTVEPAYVLNFDLDTVAQNEAETIIFYHQALELARTCHVYSDYASPGDVLCSTCCRELFRSQNGAGTLPELKLAFTDYFAHLLLKQKYYRRLLKAGKSSWIQRNWRKDSRKLRLWLALHLPKTTWKVAQLQRPRRSPEFLRYQFPQQLQGNILTKTECGFLANVPQHSTIGDIIVIFYGWKTPFLLRPVPTGYLLVGECYVYGMMHGGVIRSNMGVEMDFDLV